MDSLYKESKSIFFLFCVGGGRGGGGGCYSK